MNLLCFTHSHYMCSKRPLLPWHLKCFLIQLSFFSLSESLRTYILDINLLIVVFSQLFRRKKRNCNAFSIEIYVGNPN